MRGLLLCNPEARRGDDARARAAQAFAEFGVEILTVESSSAAQGRAAVTFHRDHIDFVAVAGGDGTVSNLLGAVVESHLPLGLVPLGTANDLARTLSIPTELEEACRVIAVGHTRSVDLGMANGKYFANAAGLGLQPEVARQVSATSKRWIGPLAYVPAAVAAYRRSRPFRARVTVQGQEPRTLETIQLTVGNGRFFGGGLVVDEEATIDDSALHLVHVPPIGAMRLLSLVPRLYSGTTRIAEGTWVTDAEVIDIETNRRLPVTLDGEPATETPVHFAIARRVLDIFVPEDAEERTDGLSAAG